MMRALFTLNCDSNLTPNDTEKEGVQLFNKAKHSIHIVAGNIESPFYNSDKVVKALEDAVARKVEVKIVYDKSRTIGKSPESRILKIEGVVAKESKTPAPRHFMIVDEKHIRIERSHKPDAIKAPAIVCIDADLLAREWELKFATLAET